jgi:hypothetical protein
MGAGVALFDYDNDGRLDIYLVNGAPLSDPTPRGTVPQKTDSQYWNRLYHQKAEGTFEDVTEKAGLEGTGYAMGVAVGDYDNDGFEDLYRNPIWRKQALPQQRQWHIHRCNPEGGRGRRRLVYQRGMGWTWTGTDSLIWLSSAIWIGISRMSGAGAQGRLPGILSSRLLQAHFPAGVPQ